MANPVSVTELSKALEDIDVMALIDAEIKALEEAGPDDWTIKRLMEEKGIVSVSIARRLLAKVFEPLVKSGYYERMKFKNPSGGGYFVGYRKIEATNSPL